MFVFLYYLYFLVKIFFFECFVQTFILGGRGAKSGPKHKLALRKLTNDPTLSEEGKKIRSEQWAVKNQWIITQSKLKPTPTIFLMNEWEDEEFNTVNKRRIKDETWKFGYKAKYVQNRDDEGNPIRYADISWKRILCRWCPTWWTCASATSFANHLQCHTDEAMFLEEEDKRSFARVAGIDYDLLADDPESIENSVIVSKLINEYHLTHPDELAITKTPISLKKCGLGIQKLFHHSLMELIVALGSTSTAAPCRALYNFINVCIVYINIFLFFIF